MEKDLDKNTCSIGEFFKKFFCIILLLIFLFITISLILMFSEHLNYLAIQYHHLLAGLSKIFGIITPFAALYIAYSAYKISKAQKEFNQTRVSDYKKKIIFENYYSLKNRSVFISEYFFIKPVRCNGTEVYASLVRDSLDPNSEDFRTLIMDYRKICNEWSKDITDMEMLGLNNIVKFHNDLFKICEKLRTIYFKTVNSDKTAEESYLKIEEYKAEFEKEFNKSKEIYQEPLNK